MITYSHSLTTRQLGCHASSHTTARPTAEHEFNATTLGFSLQWASRPKPVDLPLFLLPIPTTPNPAAATAATASNPPSPSTS